MCAWEYKFITSGKGGFATPALLESFLNQLGQDEWEILHFQSQTDNALAFNGLARRSTQREWTLENAVTAAARAEADKLRAEFEAKFKGAGGSAAEAEKTAEDAAAEAGEGSFRKVRNTESDLDPELADEEETEEWDKIASEDELPTFFEAIQPLMRRNQRGEGVAVGVDHLAKKWNLTVEDVVAALKECGFTLPEDENSRPAYVEYEGDIFWVNVNRRGELWINSREKPRPVFRVVAGKAVTPEEPAAPAERIPEEAARPPVEEAGRGGEGRPESGEPGRSESGGQPNRGGNALPEGTALLEKIRPLMRRDRGGSGRSGSVGFLARALRCRESDLAAALESIGLRVPGAPGETLAEIDAAGGSWSLSRDHRGGIWIALRKGGRGEAGPAPTAAPANAAPEGATNSPSAGGPDETQARSAAESAESMPAAPAPSGAGSPVLSAARLLLKPTRTGGVAAETGRLAETVGKSPDDFIRSLVEAGLQVPEKPRERPVFVEQAGEIFWLNKNSKGELWLNAKPSQFSKDAPPRRSRRG